MQLISNPLELAETFLTIHWQKPEETRTEDKSDFNLKFLQKLPRLLLPLNEFVKSC
jgi:hypothetical protein